MTEPINIEVTDGVARTIQPALEGIAKGAEQGAAAVGELQKQISNASPTVQLAGAVHQLGGALAGAEISGKDFDAMLANTSETFKRLNPNLFQVVAAVKEETAALTEATASLRGYTQAQIDAFKAQQAGANFKADLNASFGLDQTTKSAKESAAAFIALTPTVDEAAASLRGYTQVQVDAMKAQQAGAAFLADLNASFGINAGVTNSAKESAAAMAAALNAEDAAFAAVAASLAVHNAGIETASTLVSQFRANLLAEADALNTVAASTEKSTAAAASGGGVWKGFIGIMAGFFVAHEIVKAVDNFTRLNNAITVAGLSGKAAADEFTFLTNVAEQNGVPIQTLAILYQRLAVAQASVGLSTDKMNTLVNVLAQSFRVQALDAQHITNTMRDLNDIVESGGSKFTRFFNNLQRADYALVAAAAKGLGISMEALSKGIQDGTISNTMFLEGIIKGQAYMQKLADVTNLTVSGALNNLGTAFTVLVSNVNQGTNAFAIIATTIQFVASNLPLITTAVLIFGAAWAAVKLYDIAIGLKAVAAALFLTDTALIPTIISLTIANGEIILTVGALVVLGVMILALTGQLDNFTKGLEQIGGVLGGVVKNGIASANEMLGGMSQKQMDAAKASLDLSNAMSEMGGGTDEATKKVKMQLTEMQKLQAQTDRMNQTTVTTTAGQDGLATTVTKSTKAWLDQDNQINKSTTTQKQVAGGIATTTTQLQTMTTALSGAGKGVTALGSKSADAAAFIRSTIGSMSDAQIAAFGMADGVANVNDALAVTITHADGSTSSIAKFTSTVNASTSAMNAAASAASAYAQGLAQLASMGSAKYFGANGPDIISVPSPGNRNGTTGSISDLPAFASGGSFMVNGRQGSDVNKVEFWASNNERVDVLTPDQQRRQTTTYAAANSPRAANVNVTIVTPDADSFRRSKAQVGRQIQQAISAGMMQ